MDYNGVSFLKGGISIPALHPPTLFQEAINSAREGKLFVFSACSVLTWPYRVEAEHFAERPGLLGEQARELPGFPTECADLPLVPNFLVNPFNNTLCTILSPILK